tara:strand:+ start:179 stop:367 length:189 start_codon:yes stop_codon:yes gene_type:complete
MTPETQNGGLPPAASRHQYVDLLQFPSTASERQVQFLICRFGLSPWAAQEVARLCFGEARDD